jgi:hypothetical protein
MPLDKLSFPMTLWSVTVLSLKIKAIIITRAKSWAALSQNHTLNVIMGGTMVPNTWIGTPYLARIP